MDHALGTRQVGRVAAALFVLSGITTLLSPLLPSRGVNAAAVAFIGAFAIASGGVVWFVPWGRWPRNRTLLLVLYAFGLIALHNWYGGGDPYRYGVFFPVAFMWIGMGHPRWTSVRMLPAFLAAYLLPLVVGREPAPALWSVVYVGPICVLVAEVLAWLASEWLRASEEVRRSAERFGSLVQHTSDLIAVFDADGVISYMSPACETLLGYPPEELVGRVVFELIHPDDLAVAFEGFGAALDAPGGLVRRDVRALHEDGTWRWLAATGRNLLGVESVRGVVLNATDVTDRRHAADVLTSLAYTDALTGLPNRAAFGQQLGAAVDAAGRRGEPLAVLFLDLDGFKLVNDRLGHAVGDELLVAAARRLQATVRARDGLARLGGDEFTVLLTGPAALDEAASVAERVIEALHRPFSVRGNQLTIGTSVGIAEGTGSESADELLRRADVAMYRAKDDGKGRWSRYDASTQLHPA